MVSVHTLRHTSERSLGIGLLFLLTLMSACFPDTDPHVLLQPHDGPQVRVNVEIADRVETRQWGLMYRHELPEFHGMLFIFPREAPRRRNGDKR